MERDKLFFQKDGSSISYAGLLRQVQEYIALTYSDELAETPVDESTRQVKRIFRYLKNRDIRLPDEMQLTEIAASIYADMAGNSFIDKYLRIPEFQELNINAWNSAYVIIKDRKKQISDTFLSPEHAVDVVKRIVNNAGGLLDQSSPRVVSNLSADTRIAASIYPIVPKESGVSASIRRVNKIKASDQKLSMEKEATPEILGFLEFCAEHGVSLCMAGSTYSGKSTLEAYILNHLSIEHKKRILTIEDGSRQLDLKKYDSNGKPTNDVVQFLTRKSEKKDQDISQIDLMELTMKYHPDVICVDEMVSAEAYITVETARTGHVVLSSIHSLGAENTYSKIATLAQQVSSYTYETLLRLAVEAFPIIVYMKPLDDGVRRVMEVLEGERFTPDRGLVCRSLYRFDTFDTVTKADGSVEVKGNHSRISGISPNLQRLLLNSGAPRSAVMEYAKGA